MEKLRITKRCELMIKELRGRLDDFAGKTHLLDVNHNKHAPSNDIDMAFMTELLKDNKVLRQLALNEVPLVRPSDFILDEQEEQEPAVGTSYQPASQW